MNCTAFSKGASASGSQYYREFLMYCITRLSVCIGECKQTASTDDKALEASKLLKGENVILLWYIVTKLLMGAGTTFFLGEYYLTIKFWLLGIHSFSGLRLGTDFFYGRKPSSSELLDWQKWYVTIWAALKVSFKNISSLQI